MKCPPVHHVERLLVGVAWPRIRHRGYYSSRSDRPGWSSGRRPSGQRNFRSASVIGRSLMHANRRRYGFAGFSASPRANQSCKRQLMAESGPPWSAVFGQMPPVVQRGFGQELPPPVRDTSAVSERQADLGTFALPGNQSECFLLAFRRPNRTFIRASSL